MPASSQSPAPRDRPATAHRAKATRQRPQTQLLAVPNISEGKDRSIIQAVGQAFEDHGAKLLHLHSDPHHHRSVYTLQGPPAILAHALLAGFQVAVGNIDISDGRGQHPHVGAVDVAPIVHLHEAQVGAAVAEALLLADLLGAQLHVPVLLYGVLGGGRTRAQIRRGGVEALKRKLAAKELRTDFGPPLPHPSAGVTLVAARGPLVAFNLQLAPPAGLAEAKRIAALIREGGAQGLPKLRAIGVALRSPQGQEIGQVSMNVEDPDALPLADIVAVVARHAQVRDAEIVGLVPQAALQGFPPHIEIIGFRPERQLLQKALGL